MVGGVLRFLVPFKTHSTTKPRSRGSPRLYQSTRSIVSKIPLSLFQSPFLRVTNFIGDEIVNQDHSL